jgi:hypothetical protein
MAKIRYPLAQAFASRDGSITAKDSFVQNAYLSKHGDKSYVMKRPGTLHGTTFSDLANFQGAIYSNGAIYAVIRDVLYLSSLVNSSTNGTAFTLAGPPWAKRTSQQSVIFHDSMFVLGAGIDSAGNPHGDIWSTADGINWSLATAGAGVLRLDHRCVVFQDNIYMLAGRQPAGTVLNDVLSSPDGTNWTQVTANASWSARQSFGLVVLGNNMILFGGDDGAGGYKNDVWSTPDGVNWTQISTAAAWSARTGFAYAVFNGKIYLMGGTDAGLKNDVWSTPDGINWTQTTAAAFASARYRMGATVYNNKIWVIGGVTAGATQVADVYSSVNGITFSLVTSMPGFSARGSPCVQAFKTPTTVSPYRFPTLWVFAGGLLGSEDADVWFGNINTMQLASYTLSPAVINQPYQFNTFENGTILLLKNQSNFWVLANGAVTKVVDPNYPAVTVPGIAVLNSFAYVCTPGGTILACKIDDATIWPSLQFTTADYEDDPAIWVGKYLNYVTVFGQFTIQFFYDAGNPPPGIPINPYINANLRMGCAQASTVQNIKNTLIWVGATPERNWGVYIMDGMVPKKVSSDWVDRVVNENLAVDTQSFVTAAGTGHTFYVLCFNLSTRIALVYDMDTQQWHVWTAPGGFNWSHAVTYFSGADVWLGWGNRAGNTFFASKDYFDDDAVPFPVMVQTDKLDGGSLQRKFWGCLDFVADQSPATIAVSWSDDDYATFSQPTQMVNSSDRPRMYRLGSSRRRAFRFSQQDSNPARWEAAEITYSEGES